MKGIGLLLASSMVALAAMPGLAQPSPGPSEPGPMMYGYGHMWGGGWHPGMVFGPVVMLLALVGIVALIVWLVRAFGDGAHRHGGGRRALEILEERLARGEIGKEEFEEKRRLLRG